jgi:hypothetical protein
MSTVTIALDLAKNVFEIAVAGRAGAGAAAQAVFAAPVRTVLAVATANKLARIAWAVWHHERTFNGNHVVRNAA